MRFLFANLPWKTWFALSRVSSWGNDFWRKLHYWYLMFLSLSGTAYCLCSIFLTQWGWLSFFIFTYDIIDIYLLSLPPLPLLWSSMVHLASSNYAYKVIDVLYPPTLASFLLCFQDFILCSSTRQRRWWRHRRLLKSFFRAPLYAPLSF